MWCTRCCRTSQASSSRSVPLLCLPSLSSPPCTASRSPSVRERPAGFTAGRSALLQLSAPGAFAVSFLALRDLMRVIEYSSATGWIFPAIIDTAVAVSTMMLVALGDKPARRTRTVTTPSNTQTPTMQRLAQPSGQSAKTEVTRVATTRARAQTSASVQPDRAQTVQDSVQTKATQVDAEIAQVDADLASQLIASGATTQPVETVIAVLAARRDGASINAAAKASGISYRTAQRIVEGAEHRQRQLVAVG
jgi:Protein of unknown function (DUF2637)